MDGVEAHDHVLRSSFLAKLHSVPSLQGLLPFVRSICARNTTYMWEDEAGVTILWLQSGTGQHSRRAVVGGCRCPAPHRKNKSVESRRIMPHRIGRFRGGSVESRRHQDFGHSRGVAEFVDSVIERRKTREGCGKQSHGFQISSVRGKFLSSVQGRTLPPSLSAEYAHRHDDGMWQAMGALLEGLTGTEEQKSTTWQLTTLPLRMGGPGLRCAGRMAPAAYWSSWADTLPMIHERLPQAAQNVVDGLQGAQEVGGCTWQYFASSIIEHHFRKTTVLRQSCPSQQAHQ